VAKPLKGDPVELFTRAQFNSVRALTHSRGTGADVATNQPTAEVGRIVSCEHQKQHMSNTLWVEISGNEVRKEGSKTYAASCS